MPCLDGLNQAVSTRIQHRTVARTKPETCPAPSPPPSSRVAFCDSPICPTTRSTASADMKQPFGAKPARSFLLLMPWIAAKHGIEGAVSVSEANKNSRSTVPGNLNFELIQALLDHCSSISTCIPTPGFSKHLSPARRVLKDHGIDRIERPVLPCSHLIEDCVRAPADEVRGDVRA
jgi:hypothetical protein